MKYAEDEVPIPAMLEEQRKLWVNTMNHIRHDWLNDLQLILGYVQMKKYDKLAACVDMLKQRMTEESRASKLGNLELVELLFTYRSRPLPYRFALQLDESIDVNACRPSGNAVHRAVRMVLNTFEEAAMLSEREMENVLSCSFHKGPIDVLLRFTYKGAYSEALLSHGIGTIEEALLQEGLQKGVSSEYTGSNAAISLRFPLRA